jgi:hypothetical protein
MNAIESQNKLMKQMKAISLFVLLFLCAVSSSFAGSNNPDNLSTEEGYVLTQEELDQSEVLSVSNNTLFSYTIPQVEYVRLSIYDKRGREISVLIDEIKKAGEFSAELVKANLVKGTYYYRLVVGKYKEIKKLNIIK